MLLRDKFWLWGHPEGRYNTEYGNHKISRMTPMEGCLYLGVRNVFMVPVEWEVNERQYNKSFKTLNHVGWGYCFYSRKYFGFRNVLDTILQQSHDFPNIDCVAFDDFKFRDRYKDHSMDELTAAVDRLHNGGARPLDCWMVLYTKEFGVDPKEDAEFQPYIDQMDGVIMWNWRESEWPSIPEKFARFQKLTARKRRMIGIYLYNFGEQKEASAEAVLWQLNWARERLIAGDIEGIVLHTNTMADLDMEAYDAACAWMEAHGDEQIPE